MFVDKSFIGKIQAGVTQLHTFNVFALMYCDLVLTIFGLTCFYFFAAVLKASAASGTYFEFCGGGFNHFFLEARRTCNSSIVNMKADDAF